MEILLAEDTESIGELLVDVLYSLYKDIHITWKMDGVSALDEYIHNQDKYDIIITDFNMPSLDGGKLAESIKKHGDSVPIFLWSSSSPDDYGDYVGYFTDVIQKDDFDSFKDGSAFHMCMNGEDWDAGGGFRLY